MYVILDYNATTSGPQLISLQFSISNRVGALSEALQVFRSHNVDLKKIEYNATTPQRHNAITSRYPI